MVIPTRLISTHPKTVGSGWTLISVNYQPNSTVFGNEQGLCHFVGPPGRFINCPIETTGMSGLGSEESQ